MMRRTVVLLGPLVASVALFAFACEDSGSSSGDITNPDAASFDGGALPDGTIGQLDGAVGDALADGALTSSVTVHVLRAGVAAANVTVVFHDATGAVLETKSTDATGRASSTPSMPPAQASALLGAGNFRRIITWTAVEAGDELFTSDIGTFQSEGLYSVTMQGTFADGGAEANNVSIGPCTNGAAGAVALVNLSPECARPATAILARAMPSAQDRVFAYAFTKGKLAPVDGGTATATVGPWLATSRVTITPKNAPAGTSSALLSDIESGLGFPNTYGTDLDRTGKFNYDVAPGFADAYQAGVRVDPNAVLGSTLLVTKRVAPAANVEIDFAGALPSLDGVTLGVTDPKRPQIDWTVLGNASLATSDGGSVAVEWADFRGDNRGWTLIVPPAAKSVKAPAMPATAAAWIPRGASDAGAPSNFSAPNVAFIEADVLPTYAAFRRDVGRLMPLSELNDRETRAVLPVNGTLKATSFRPPAL